MPLFGRGLPGRERRATGRHGYAFEVAGSGANRTSHEENCETSAIGRALANMGYATSHKDRPSREEMSKASRDDRPAAPVSHDKPTDKQIKMVFALARQIGFDDDKVNTLAREHGAESLSSLTRRQISALIERLQSLSDQAREQPPTQSQPMTPDDGEYSWTDFWRWARGHGFASKAISRPNSATTFPPQIQPMSSPT